MRLFRNPVLCNYYVTYRCNASCGFCDIWERPSPYVTIEDVETNLRCLKKLGVKVIDFTGGEPLLHRQLPEFLALARKLGFITTVTTNTLLYPKLAETLAGNVDMLHFSLDSIDPAKHNASRNVPCFDFLIESIGVAKRLGEHPDILFTVFDHNIGEIEEVYERFCTAEGLTVILNPAFSYQDIGESLDPESIAQLRKWAGKPGIYLNTAFLDLRQQGGNQITDPVCDAGNAVVVISPENKLLLPCYHLAEQAFPIERNLAALWMREDIRALRAQAGRLPACQGCEINCYMEPSFTTRLNSWWWKSLPSTLGYALDHFVFH